MKRVGWVWSGIERLARRSRVLRLSGLLAALSLLLTFLAYWHSAGLPPPPQLPTAERWIEPLTGTGADVAGLAGQTAAPDFSQARWTPVSLPDIAPAMRPAQSGGASSLARVWMRVRTTPPAGPAAAERLAVYVTRVLGGGAWSVWLDGRLVEANLENWRMQWNVPLYVKLPPGAVAPGQTAVIDIAFPVDLARGYAFGSLTVGETAAVDHRVETRLLWQCVLPKASFLITLLLGFIALHYGLDERGDRAYLRLAFAAIVWAVGNMRYFGNFPDGTAALWFRALEHDATAWLVPAMTLFVTQFDRDRWPRLQTGMVAYALLATVATLPVWPWPDGGRALQYLVSAVLLLLVFGYFTGRAFAGGSRDLKIIMVAVLSLPLTGLQTVYAATTRHAPDAVDLYPYSAFVVFGAFLYVMQRRYLAARQALEEANATLDHRLRQREAELEEQHRKLMSAEKDRVVQHERQRIMRDMHDGIGTALMSSLASAERGALTPARTAELLRDSLDELKMVIDSLEPIDDDLATLLASLRYRFGQRIEDAGIKIVWEMGDLPLLPWLDPSRALQVLRIVQEALTNVIKHAHADKITIGAQPGRDEADRSCVIVRVADNGIGFDPAQARKGRGLNNLRQRAADLGAVLDIRSEPGGGTVLSLRLPVEPA